MYLNIYPAQKFEFVRLSYPLQLPILTAELGRSAGVPSWLRNRGARLSHRRRPPAVGGPRRFEMTWPKRIEPPSGTRERRPPKPRFSRSVVGPANGSDAKLQAAHTRERTSGAPLATKHEQLTLSVCKRRDAVRLALHEPARPAGAALGGLSTSASS